MPFLEVRRSQIKSYCILQNFSLVVCQDLAQTCIDLSKLEHHLLEFREISHVMVWGRPDAEFTDPNPQCDWPRQHVLKWNNSVIKVDPEVKFFPSRFARKKKILGYLSDWTIAARWLSLVSLEEKSKSKLIIRRRRRQIEGDWNSSEFTFDPLIWWSPRVSHSLKADFIKKTTISSGKLKQARMFLVDCDLYW